MYRGGGKGGCWALFPLTGLFWPRLPSPRSTLYRSPRPSSLCSPAALAPCLMYVCAHYWRFPPTHPLTTSSDCEHCLTASMHRPCSTGPSSH
jgi:hypothetical protein